MPKDIALRCAEYIDAPMPKPQMTITFWHTCGDELTITCEPEAVTIDGREYARFHAYFSCCKESGMVTVGPMDWPPNT